jgi:hypothetical protein
MESTDSMAREDKDGSGTERVVMAMSPLFFGKGFLGEHEKESRAIPALAKFVAS